MKNFKLMFETIPPYPGLNISIVEENQDNLVEQLQEFSSKIDATLYVKSLGKRVEIKSENIRVKKFSFEDAKYNNFSILYDFFFLCADVCERDDKESIFKKIYRVMKNAGDLFVFVRKDEREECMELLESINFVALNSIDLNETIDVVTAKKMHGWKKV